MIDNVQTELHDRLNLYLKVSLPVYNIVPELVCGWLCGPNSFAQRVFNIPI